MSDTDMTNAEHSALEVEAASSDQAITSISTEISAVVTPKIDLASDDNVVTTSQTETPIASQTTSTEASQPTPHTKLDESMEEPQATASESVVKVEAGTPETLKRKEPSPSSETEPSSTANPQNGTVPTTNVPSDPEGTGNKKQKVDAASDSSAATSAPPPAPLMISRDDMAKMEEDGGMLKFDVISNDGKPEHMMQLTTLKNIFARQLPKMPREYIVRLVFDRNHRSMIILKNGKTVIGGICYRPFEANHFGEIAFCAINAADQVKGYGTRLMNHLKEYVKAFGITHFLTYADNYAIGYFKKQGFSKVVSMPRPNWFGYIKDYDGGTLMECTLHHQINYLRITSMVQQQRKKIQDKIKERSHADIVYPGLTRFAEGRTMDLYLVPGVQEAGWSHAVIRNSRVGTRDPGSLKTQLQQLYKHVFSHRSAWPFHEPVDTTIVVDYLDYIKEPIDLTLIQKRIDSGHYLSKAAFKLDLDKMCANCMIYNTPDTNYYKAAKDLQEFIEKRIQVPK